MTTLKKGSIILILILSILITGCEKSIFCIQGEGTVTTEILNISNFDGIDLSSSANVLIKQGTTLEVKATGHPNIIEKLKRSVSNNIWEITLDNNCYQNYELSIEITMPNINSLKISGSGSVTMEDFTNQNNLWVKISGSGEMTLNGFEGITSLEVDISGSGKITANRDITTLNTLSLDISGSGEYTGFAISSNDCTVNISGSGECEVSVVNSLDVNISGSGEVYYKGTPSITQDISGSGNLINAN